MAADNLTAALEEIRERNEHMRTRYGYVGGLLALAGAKDDFPRLLAAVEAVLKLADEWTEGSYGSGSALDEDRGWVRAACGAKVRKAITTSLSRKEGSGEDVTFPRDPAPAAPLNDWDF